jgi:hypothetical protein
LLVCCDLVRLLVLMSTVYHTDKDSALFLTAKFVSI